MSAPEPIRTLFGGVDIVPLKQALDEHPELWNQVRARTESPASPHHEVDDIWVRYAPVGVSGETPHDSLWYWAADLLPVKDIVYRLAYTLRADRIGGVLITRIPPGKSVKPHVDRTWHASFYRKFAVQVASAPQQAFCFKGVRHESVPGDVYEFDNSHCHWVTNDSDEERITMIVCLRIEQSLQLDPYLERSA